MVRLAECCASERWSAQISAVISNEPGAGGLDHARQLGLPAEVLEHRKFASREQFDQALGDRIARLEPDLIVLAGFMRILGEAFVNRFAGRIVNIHPSLLPAFPGLDTHARALAEGVAVHGATVHFVTAELDAGPIIAQAVVPTLPGDDPDSLRQRVQQAEHQLFPAAIRDLLSGDLKLVDQHVQARDASVARLIVPPL